MQNQRKLKNIIMYYNWHMLSNWMSLPSFKKHIQHFWNAGTCFLLLERMRKREWNIVTKVFQCFKENVVSSAHQVQQQEFIFTENTKKLDSSLYLAAFTDKGPCRQRAGLSIYYMKAEWQNLLNSGPCWSTFRSNRSYNNQQ